MSVDPDLLDLLIKIQNEKPLRYTLHLNDLEYPLDEVVIKNSPTPVNSPTTRGGVYFSDKFAYKLRGIVHDLSVVPILSKTMLGPNTDFGEIKITTNLELDGDPKTLSLYTNLTNSVQRSSQIELNLILIRIES